MAEIISMVGIISVAVQAAPIVGLSFSGDFLSKWLKNKFI